MKAMLGVLGCVGGRKKGHGKAVLVWVRRKGSSEVVFNCVEKRRKGYDERVLVWLRGMKERRYLVRLCLVMLWGRTGFVVL